LAITSSTNSGEEHEPYSHNSEEIHALSTLRKIAEVSFPTRWAAFRLLAFERQGEERGLSRIETALALVLGDIYAKPPLVRIHSQCATGDIFHSLRCDCHDQLHLALRSIGEEGAGILLYEYQEGRGIGLMEKLRAYELQDAGLDTIEANLHLGHEADLRDYRLPAEILRFLKIYSIRLMTNNPEKMKAVASSNIRIEERISAEVLVSPHAARYFATKRDKMGHLTGPDHAAPISCNINNEETSETPGSAACCVRKDGVTLGLHS
jgi:GTP cyclohydrolase II